MLIIGAGGFAKQLLEVCDQLKILDEVVLFDDVSSPAREKLFDRLPIIHTTADAGKRFSSGRPEFTVGIGAPAARKKLSEKFSYLGGRNTSLISPLAIISRLNTGIGNGTSVLTHSIIESDVSIGEGALINLGVFITHDCVIGDFAEICPGVKLSGGCTIGSLTHIGTGAIVIPKVKIGKNVIIGAGAVVTKDIPDNVMAAGVPARVIKEIE